MADKSKQKPNIEKLDFETALAQLEEIVAQLEQGQIGLTDSLEQYEAGYLVRPRARYRED